MKRFILISLFLLSNIAVFIQAAETDETQKKGMLSGITGIFKKEKKDAPGDIKNEIRTLTTELAHQQRLKNLNEIAFKNLSERLKNNKDLTTDPKRRNLIKQDKKSTRNHLKQINKQIREIEKELKSYEREYILSSNFKEELEKIKSRILEH